MTWQGFERIGAVVAVVVVLLLGLLPRLALSMSGLTALDDRRAQGRSSWRRGSSSGRPDENRPVP